MNAERSLKKAKKRFNVLLRFLYGGRVIPESKLIEHEVTVRQLTLTKEVVLSKRAMVRWLALALGLISPNESRQSLLDVLEVLLEFHFDGVQPTSGEVIEAVNKKSSAISPKTVRYHLTQLTKKGIIQCKNRRYSFPKSDYPNDSLSSAVYRVYEKTLKESFSRIDKVLEMFERNR